MAPSTMPLPKPEEFPSFRSFAKTFWTSFMLVSCWLYKSNLLASEKRRETLVEEMGKRTNNKKKKNSSHQLCKPVSTDKISCPSFKLQSLQLCHCSLQYNEPFLW